MCPTQWQKDQFPQELQEKIVVQFDGIDCSLFAPQKTQEPFFLSGEDTQAPLVFSSDQLLLLTAQEEWSLCRYLSSCGRQPLPSSASRVACCGLWPHRVPPSIQWSSSGAGSDCWMNLMVSSTGASAFPGRSPTASYPSCCVAVIALLLQPSLRRELGRLQCSSLWVPALLTVSRALRRSLRRCQRVLTLKIASINRAVLEALEARFTLHPEESLRQTYGGAWI